MAAGAWVFTDKAKADILDGTLVVGPDTFKMSLVTTGSNLATGSTTWAAVTNEHANQGAPGYETGGASIDLTVGAAGASVKIDIATDPEWTATGGNITAKWAVIYEVAGDVLCFALLDSGGADVTATTGNTLTVAANASNGVASLTSA